MILTLISTKDMPFGTKQFTTSKNIHILLIARDLVPAVRVSITNQLHGYGFESLVHILESHNYDLLVEGELISFMGSLVHLLDVDILERAEKSSKNNETMIWLAVRLKAMLCPFPISLFLSFDF